MPAGRIFRNRTALGKSTVPLGLPQKYRISVVDLQTELLYSAFMMWYASIISVALTSIFPFHMVQKMPLAVTGKKVPGSICSAKWSGPSAGSSVIAEDLGYVTDSVRQLVHDSGFPGMKVLEFAFDSRDSGCANDYLPHNYPENSVAYTGTHDNETIAGWWKSITAKERKLARDYLCDNYTPDKELHKCFISLVMRSSAKLCVIPMQDYMGLDNSCRMNQPSTVGKNWKWRIRKRELTVKLQKEIHGIALRYGRMNWSD